jgi:hypothetical protein
MSDHGIAAHGAAAGEVHPVPDTLVADRRTLWADFGKLLLGNVIVIAVVLILMAIFLV